MSFQKSINPLHHRVVLAAQGFSLTLALRAPGRGSTKRTLYFFADAQLEATLNNGPYVVGGSLSGLLPDCLRLCDWIEEHIENLATRHAAGKTVLDERIHTHGPWVPLELGIQIQCLRVMSGAMVRRWQETLRCVLWWTQVETPLVTQ